METATADTALSAALDSKLRLTPTASVEPIDPALASPPATEQSQPQLGAPILSDTPSPPTSFPLFASLPAELRVKIWQYSFLPRAVELHARRAHYADSARPRWHSRSFNPAALATCAESRALALEVYTVVVPLASDETESDRDRDRDRLREISMDSDWEHVQHRLGHVPSTPPSERPSARGRDGNSRAEGAADGKVLYLAPRQDMLVVLGDFNRRVQQLVQDLLPSQRPAERRGPNGNSPSSVSAGTSRDQGSPGGEQQRGRDGLQRLALSLGPWVHDHGRGMLRAFSVSVFAALEEFVLFMYTDRMPPPEWRRGTVLLHPCEDQYAYRQLLLGRGSQFRDREGWMRVGKGRLSIRDLEFVDGW